VLRAVLFDVDGTLVDSNDQHARAWVDAFTEAGIVIPFERVRRCIGMGGDKLMPEVSGLTEDSARGSAIAKRRGEIFRERYLSSVQPFPGAADLVAAVKRAGLKAVAASSAQEQELKPLLAIAGAEWLMDAATSSDDADASKPDPDIIHAALSRVAAAPCEALMVGDTPYDIEAAARAGVRTVAFRSGGWNDTELRDAIAIYAGARDLLDQFDRSPLGVRRASR
jgi:HAD superfamily hydrolase (TIGR01509 family)